MSAPYLYRFNPILQRSADDNVLVTYSPEGCEYSDYSNTSYTALSAIENPDNRVLSLAELPLHNASLPTMTFLDILNEALSLAQLNQNLRSATSAWAASIDCLDELLSKQEHLMDDDLLLQGHLTAARSETGHVLKEQMQGILGAVKEANNLRKERELKGPRYRELHQSMPAVVADLEAVGNLKSGRYLSHATQRMADVVKLLRSTMSEDQLVHDGLKDVCTAISDLACWANLQSMYQEGKSGDDLKSLTDAKDLLKAILGRNGTGEAAPGDRSTATGSGGNDVREYVSKQAPEVATSLGCLGETDPGSVKDEDGEAETILPDDGDVASGAVKRAQELVTMMQEFGDDWRARRTRRGV